MSDQSSCESSLTPRDDAEEGKSSTSLLCTSCMREEQKPPRGPSSIVERQIQSAIERRKATMKDSSDNSGFDEHEIHGTYEYLDHTADVQLHSWGRNLSQALEQLVVAMFGYMTRLSSVTVNEHDSNTFANQIEVQGHDIQSLVFNFLQEWLFVFHDTSFIAKAVTIDHVDRGENFRIRSHGHGELAVWSKHDQGVEVKAVTYNCLRVVEDTNRCDIWVIIDI